MRCRPLRWTPGKTAVALTYAGALASMSALAENWTVTPALGVRETYTTNSNLGPSGQQQDNWVTSLTGSIAVNGVGARARLNGTVALTGVLYATDSQNNYLYPSVNLLGNIEAIEYASARSTLLATTPSSHTRPRSTTMRIGGLTWVP